MSETHQPGPIIITANGKLLRLSRDGRDLGGATRFLRALRKTKQQPPPQKETVKCPSS
jgi:hypothetical protein